MKSFEQMDGNVKSAVTATKQALADHEEMLNVTKQKGSELIRKLRAYPERLIDENLSWNDEHFSFGVDDFWLCQIDEITFVDKAPQKEGVENILGTFRGLNGYNFVYMIIGSRDKTRFYLGVAKNKTVPSTNNFQVVDVGEKLLRPAIQGNFRGCKLNTVPEERGDDSRSTLSKRDILYLLHRQDFCSGMMDGVPGMNMPQTATGNVKENFQGIDRLVDVMQGCEYGIVIVARPCVSREADDIANNLYAAVDMLTPVVKRTLQISKSSNLTYNDTNSFGTNNQKSYSVQDGIADNFAHTEGSGSDIRRDVAKQISKSHTDTVSDGFSRDKSYLQRRELGNQGKEHEEIHEHEKGDNQSTSTQDANGRTYNFNTSENTSETKSESKQHSDNHSHTETTSLAISDNDQLSCAEVGSQNFSLNEQLETEMKSAADWIKYIDEILLPRIDNGNGKGIFNVCTYMFAENEIAAKRLSNTIISLYSGSVGNKAALRYIKFDEIDVNSPAFSCYNLLSNFQVPAAFKPSSHTPYETLLSKLTGRVKYVSGDNKETIFCGSWMSAKELGLMAGFPQREIIGLKLREEVEFGLNVPHITADKRIELGNMVQCGREIETVKIALDKDELDKHTFIAGVTGSGKTTTCQKILIDCDLPFLVVEPAKTEYRAVSDHPKLKDGEVIYFTPGRQGVAPFFLNPFELFEDEEISSRADMLKATFEASFEMEAAIPQIMGTAIYTAYQDKGWNTATTTWRNKKATDADGPFADGVYAFPTLSDFKVAVKKVIEKQGFDDRLRDEYLGSINARIESLMIGAKGQMLNTPRSIDFKDLVNRRVVIELEGIKSGAEKSLIMGLVMTNVLQAVKFMDREYKKVGRKFRHITLVEEAHRLLSRYMPGDNRNQKQGVEVFADMLAEVRKYGESLIIVDQIPDKMTPEVLKNTNTKIVHKLFAKDDKDAIGNTMSLSDEQKNFLSNLPPGRAIVFSQGWDKAIQIQVERKSNTGDNDIAEEEIHHRSLKYYSQPAVAKRGVVPGLQDIPSDRLNEQTTDEMLWLRQQSYNWLDVWKEKLLLILSPNGNTSPSDTASWNKEMRDIVDGINEAVKKIGIVTIVGYIEKSFMDIIHDKEVFQEKTKELLESLSVAKHIKDGIETLQMYNVAMRLQDICKIR